MKTTIFVILFLMTSYGQINKISYVKYVDSLTYIKPLAMKEIVIKGEASEQLRELISQTGMSLNKIFVFGSKSDGVNIEIGEKKEISKLNNDKMEYVLHLSIDTSGFYDNYMKTFKKVSPRRVYFLLNSCISNLIINLNKNCDKITFYKIFPENSILIINVEGTIEEFINTFDDLDPDDTEEGF